MSRLSGVADSRELVLNLALRELRGKYKRSTLGWTWSLLNPLSTMVIFTVIFSVFLKVEPPVGDPSGLKSFPLFLLCGLLPWTFFSSGMGSSAQALIANSNLIKKVYFRRELIVLSLVLALFVTFCIEMSVFGVVLLISGNMILPWIPVAFVLMVIVAMLVLGIGLIASVANVYFRDVEHFLAILTQALFYSTPIVYPITVVPKHHDILGINLPVREIYELNPLVRMVEVFRDVLYDLRVPNLASTGYLLLWCAVILAFGLWLFRRADRRLAEEI